MSKNGMPKNKCFASNKENGCDLWHDIIDFFENQAKQKLLGSHQPSMNIFTESLLLIKLKYLFIFSCESVI